MTMAAAPAAVPRIVLDTNVCLDLFLFADPLSSHVMAAMRDGAIQAVTRPDCRDEWLRVLHYPQLPIDDAARPRLWAEYDRWLQVLPMAAMGEGEPLPRCVDPDDQMFMELARDGGAAWLLSKDNALLKLNRTTQARGLFRICLPQDWSVAEVVERTAVVAP